MRRRPSARQRCRTTTSVVLSRLCESGGVQKYEKCEKYENAPAETLRQGRSGVCG